MVQRQQKLPRGTQYWPHDTADGQVPVSKPTTHHPLCVARVLSSFVYSVLLSTTQPLIFVFSILPTCHLRACGPELVDASWRAAITPQSHGKRSGSRPVSTWLSRLRGTRSALICSGFRWPPGQDRTGLDHRQANCQASTTFNVYPAPHRPPAWPGSLGSSVLLFVNRPLLEQHSFPSFQRSITYGNTGPSIIFRLSNSFTQ